VPTSTPTGSRASVSIPASLTALLPDGTMASVSLKSYDAHMTIHLVSTDGLVADVRMLWQPATRG
jgi:hypothetical protein